MADDPRLSGWTGSTVLTIGHSNHSIERFTGLVRQHRVEVVVDVRSHPRSRFAPHFDRAPLELALREAGVRYLYLGSELGGRPPEATFYDAEHHVRYDRVAASPRFRRGLERLMRGARSYRIVMMCSEEDPADCHRRALVGRVLQTEGVAVAHIRGDGAVQSEASIAKAERAGTQDRLFDDALLPGPWRSARPHPAPQPASDGDAGGDEEG